MCRKPIGHGLFLRCLRGDAGGDACVGIGLDFLLRMTGFVVPDGMQWSVGIFPLFSQCDPAGRRPAKSSIEELHRNKPSLRGAHNSLRIAPEEATDRTKAGTPGAIVRQAESFVIAQ